MLLAERSDKKKNPTMREYRELMFDELKNVKNHISVIDRNNRVSSVKVTSVKSWKRRPLDLDINVKYGLYEYFTIYIRDCKPDMTIVTLDESKG